MLNQAGRQYDDVMQRSFCFLLASSSIFRSTGCKVLGMKIAQTLGVLLFSAARGHHSRSTMDGGNASTSPAAACGWNFIVLMSRQGKIRLSEFFSSYTDSEKRRILRDIAADVLPRQPKMCNIIEKGTYKFVYRRYASLYFVAGVPEGMNELIVLEQIHLFVEALDSYFSSGE